MILLCVGRGLAPAAFAFKHGIAREWFGTIYRSRPRRIGKMRSSYVAAGASPRPTRRNFLTSSQTKLHFPRSGKLHFVTAETSLSAERKTSPYGGSKPPPYGEAYPLRHAYARHLSRGERLFSLRREPKLHFASAKLHFASAKLHFPQSGKLHLTAGACSRRSDIQNRRVLRFA